MLPQQNLVIASQSLDVDSWAADLTRVLRDFIKEVDQPPRSPSYVVEKHNSLAAFPSDPRQEPIIYLLDRVGPRCVPNSQALRVLVQCCRGYANMLVGVAPIPQDTQTPLG